MKGMLFKSNKIEVLGYWNEVVLTLNPGHIVDAFRAAARFYGDNGYPALRDYYTDAATAVMHTPWYRDWLKTV